MIQTKRLFIKMLAFQTLATCVVGLIALVTGGKSAAISGLLGGFSVVFASAFASLVFVRNRNKHDATAILISLILAEVVKLAFVFIFLFLVFKQYKSLVPFSLIVGLMAAAVLSSATISSQQKK
jgi:F0F1-type ATP synthase assembly protein I